MIRLLIAALWTGALLSACQWPLSSATCNAQIDWVDFIQVGAIRYVAGTGSAQELQPSDLGPVVAHVKFKVSGNVCDPNYRPKDGDAAFLDPGTAVYSIAGQATSRAVAAYQDGRLIRYSAPLP